jgi:hypothetical protein
MAQSTGPSDRQRAEWSWLYHVGVHQGAVNYRPEIADLGLDEVRRVCDRVWVYSRADFDPTFSSERPTSQWRETCALAGSIAESLMLGAATYVECVWHRNAIAAETEPAGMAIAQRYLADNAVEAAVGVGHRLINFVARVARTVPSTYDRFGTVKRFASLGPDYRPFETDAEGAWLSLNSGTVDALRSAIPAVHRTSLIALNDLVKSQAWEAAFQIRAENFHRWRKEHESVTGIDRHSGPGHDLYHDDGTYAGAAISALSRPHTISEGLTERTTEIAGRALRTVAVTVEAVLDDTLNALPQITPTRFAFEIARDGRNRKIWPVGRPPSPGLDKRDSSTN